MTATVIIPTTGSNDFKKALESVSSQTYPCVAYVVVDGPDYKKKVDILLDGFDNARLKVCVLPQNVGSDGFYGHRV